MSNPIQLPYFLQYVSIVPLACGTTVTLLHHAIHDTLTSGCVNYSTCVVARHCAMMQYYSTTLEGTHDGNTVSPGTGAIGLPEFPLTSDHGILSNSTRTSHSEPNRTA